MFDDFVIDVFTPGISEEHVSGFLDSGAQVEGFSLYKRFTFLSLRQVQ